MLPRDERRRLEEIETQLSVEDPDFTRRMSAGDARRALLKGVSPRLAAAIGVAGLAALCLILNEGVAFLEASILSTALFLSRKWDIRA